jgi:hypothetical protein
MSAAAVPSPDNLPEWLAWLATIGVQETSALLDRLHVQPGEHRHFALPYDPTTAKRYFLSRCLLDVQHAIASLVRLRAWLLKPGEGEPSRALDDITTASIAIEQSGWRRKLIEALARLVLFSGTNSDEHYWRYLLVCEADEARRDEHNFAEDWASTSVCLARRAEFLQSQIASLPATGPLWYAQETKQGPRSRSATEILRPAILAAKPAEQAALGYSYAEGFSEPSRLLHFSTTPLRSSIGRTTITFGSSHLHLLVNAITRRVAELAGLSDLVAKLEPTVSSTLLPDVGDFVVVTLDRKAIYLAEVLAWTRQLRAIGSVRVRFIDAPPYEGVTEDELPSNLVQPFQRGRELMEGLLAQSSELAGVPGEARREACRSAVREAWNVAFRSVWLEGLGKS